MKVLGWVATFMSVMMYVSYFPQIMNNLAGQKGNFIQPLVAAINCNLWVYYGLFKKERDIPLAAAVVAVAPRAQGRAELALDAADEIAPDACFAICSAFLEL